MVFLGYRPRGSWLPAFSEHLEHQEHRFLMIILPTPRKGLMPPARQVPRRPELAESLERLAGAGLEILLLIVAPR